MHTQNSATNPTSVTKDQLGGTVSLDTLFQQLPKESVLCSLNWFGSSFVRDGEIACAFIGNPRFCDIQIAKTNSATQQGHALIQTWRKYGTSLPAQLRGQYAIAIIDTKQKIIFLSVDRFATQTLCYRHTSQEFAFSNRADCVSGRNNSPNPQAIFDFLYFHMIPAPRTIFADVFRIPAAHSLIITQDEAKLVRHWPLVFDEQHNEPFESAKHRFISLIKQSVTEEIEENKRIGAFLSGGTDSSTVAGMLCRITGKAIPAYSIGFDADGYDEMEYARIAAKHFGCEHHEYYVTPSDLVASIPAVAQYHDQPFGNSSALPSYYCAKIAGEDGCTKMLAGDGGDELFGGNARYARQQLFELYHAWPQSLRNLLEPISGEDSPLRAIPGLRQLTGYVRHSRIPMPERMQSFNLLMHLGPNNVLTPAMMAQIDVTEPIRHAKAIWSDCEAKSLINRMLAYDWRYTLADSDLPKVQGAAAMAGMNVAYPLLSDPLADFSMSLSPNWKVRRQKLRWFFKEALRDFLPDEIITKKKKGFGLPYGVWTSQTPALKSLAEDSLVSLAARGIINREFTATLLDNLLPNHPGYYGEMVWVLTVLEQWLRVQMPDYKLPL